MSRLEDLKSKLELRSAKLGVVGLGYVGLPLAVEFAKAGFSVVGFDLDAEKTRILNDGRSYIGDVPDSDVQEMHDAGRLEGTTDFSALSTCDVINVCVPTPLTKTKDPDVSYIVAAVEEIRKRLHAGQLIILGSTTYPGTTHDLYVPMLEESGLRVGSDFSVAFAPERIDPANKKFKMQNVPKVVGGETQVCTELAVKVFESVFESVVPVSSSESAEMVKLLENTFRAINIGLANEVALMCDKLGLDVWEVIDAAATKPYGFMKFVPGPGLGGHCIPVDPAYLSWKMRTLNFTSRFIETATEINSQMPEYVIRKITELLNNDRLPVNGSKILLLGIAYKADVGDMRESPALDVMELLKHKGADISYHDPHVSAVEIGDLHYKSVELSDAVLEDTDLVVILTAHGNIDFNRVVAKVGAVFDTRNATAEVREGREKITRL